MRNLIEDEVIKAEIQSGLLQVDENLLIDEFDCAFDPSSRKLTVTFTATNQQTNETYSLNDVWREINAVN